MVGYKNPPSRLGTKHTEEVKNKISKSLKGKNAGKNNHFWKGKFVGYTALHSWLLRHYKKPKYCQICGKKRKLFWANITGKYDRNIKNYKAICMSCHFFIDNIGKKMWATRKQNEK